MRKKKHGITSTQRGLGFVRRVYLLRCLGNLVVGAALSIMLVEQGLSDTRDVAMVGALLCVTLGWPHLAHRLARRAAEPIAVEHGNMLVDSALAGLWVVAMHFMLVPTVLVLLMLSMNNLAVGGFRLFAGGAAAMTLAIAVGGMLTGFRPVPVQSSLVTFVCLPLLAIYPLALGKALYDISGKLMQRTAKLRELSERDSLTGLLNRVTLSRRLDDMIGAAGRDACTVRVLFVDLDHFKTVNDSLGHGVGDQLLQAIARRLASCAGEHDAVARYGGDEFVIAAGRQHVSELRPFLDALLECIAEPVLVGERELYTEASIGVSTYPGDGSSAEVLLQKADVAMYRAKRLGRNRYQVFFPELDVEASRRMDMSTGLRKAFKAGELFIAYQPQVDMRDGHMVGVEALLRWGGADGIAVSPNLFIPLAEESGLIMKIGAWVLDAACAQLRAWQSAGLGPLTMSVNLSPIQLQHPNLAEIVHATLLKTGIDPGLLELEVTEGALMHSLEDSAVQLDKLRSLGISIAIDDFGTGYSSLSYLKKFNVDRIKIDRSFIRDIGVDKDDEAITHAIIALARALHFKVIAEGVETSAHRAFLLEHGCTDGQGFLYSPAVSPAQIEQLLKEAVTMPRLGVAS